MNNNHHRNRAILFYGGFAARSGGAFMHTVTLSEGLRARGWEVTTVTLDRLPLLVRYLPHVITALLNAIAPPLGFYYKGALTGALFRYFIKRRPNDLLVFEDIYLSWNSDNPSITVLHAVWSDNLQSFDFSERQVARLKRKEVACINRINHRIITVSQRYRDFLQQVHFKGFGGISVDVVELGLNVDRVRRTDRADNRKIGRSMVYCGALEARKNVYFMLDVFARIYAEDPAATLTIIGNGPDRTGLEQHAATHGLNVTFLGRLPHEEVPDELVKHDIYIHTALKESFSFALLEAKLAGLTTCALASLEVPTEFIDVGLDGFDPADWSARILAITERPDMAAFPDYSIGRMTERTLAHVTGRSLTNGPTRD